MRSMVEGAPAVPLAALAQLVDHCWEGEVRHRHCERSEAIQTGARISLPQLDCRVASAKRKFILSDAAGGVEGLLAMTR